MYPVVFPALCHYVLCGGSFFLEIGNMSVNFVIDLLFELFFFLVLEQVICTYVG